MTMIRIFNVRVCSDHPGPDDNGHQFLGSSSREKYFTSMHGSSEDTLVPDKTLTRVQKAE